MSRRKLWEDHQCLQVDPCRLNNETLLSFDVGFPGTTHNEIRANEINKSTYTPFLTPSLSSVTNIYRGLFCPMIRRIVQGRANLPFPARWKPQRWLYLANTFLAPPPRGVVALVSVSDDKIQITILILRRGAVSKTLWNLEFTMPYMWFIFLPQIDRLPLNLPRFWPYCVHAV